MGQQNGVGSGPYRGRRLSGMKAITDYMQRSEESVLRLIREFGFPAKKILGVWESDTEMIECWRIGLLTAKDDP